MNPNIPRQSSGGTGFIIATVILLAVIVAGALYFWKARDTYTSPNNVQTIESQSNSDDTSAIETDLNATDVNSVDYDLDPSNFTSS